MRLRSAPLAMQWPWPRCVEMIWSSGLERRAHADGDRLLADVAVHDAVDVAGVIVSGGALLEGANGLHRRSISRWLVGRDVQEDAPCGPAGMIMVGERALVGNRLRCMASPRGLVRADQSKSGGATRAERRGANDMAHQFRLAHPTGFSILAVEPLNCTQDHRRTICSLSLGALRRPCFRRAQRGAARTASCGRGGEAARNELPRTRDAHRVAMWMSQHL